MSENAKRPDPTWATKGKRTGVVIYFMGWSAPSRARCARCADDTWWRERRGYRECLRCGLLQVARR